MLPPCVSCLFFSQWCLRLENPGLQEWWSRRSSSTSWWLASNSAFFTIAFSLSLGLQGDQRPTHMHAVRRERERKLIRWTKRLEGGPTTSVSTIAKIVLSSVWFLTSSLWTLAWTAFVFRRERGKKNIMPVSRLLTVAWFCPLREGSPCKILSPACIHQNLRWVSSSSLFVLLYPPPLLFFLRLSLSLPSQLYISSPLFRSLSLLAFTRGRRNQGDAGEGMKNTGWEESRLISMCSPVCNIILWLECVFSLRMGAASCVRRTGSHLWLRHKNRSSSS